jgi:N6-adenosine-specific RNA methylase IME4
MAQSLPLGDINRKFDVIYCDCPWESNFWGVSDIKSLEIPAEDNAVLFMWATAAMLTKALQVMARWGFVYHTCAVWDKQIPDTLQWLQGQHELLLIGVKGKYTVPPTDVRVSSIHSEKSSEHSRKPDFYYSMIEQMCPNGKYLEIFAQNEHNSKWSVLVNSISQEVDEK